MSTPAIHFESLHLAQGVHPSPAEGLCLLEAVAYFAGREHNDHPPCVSPAIAAFGRVWNDALADASRQLLKPYVLRMAGTATTPEDEQRRAWMATDWLVRVFAPAWLDLAGLGTYANRLRELSELTSDELATAAQSEIAAARSAAYSAAEAAAEAAAGSAAESAAYSAAYSAARSAARSAAYSAAYSAAEAAAYSAAYSAAEAAAEAALAPTVALLQRDALTLLDRMCAVGHEQIPA